MIDKKIHILAYTSASAYIW